MMMMTSRKEYLFTKTFDYNAILQLRLISFAKVFLSASFRLL